MKELYSANKKKSILKGAVQVKTVVIITPTYNEVDNLQKLIPAIFKQIQQLDKYRVFHLVVDDNSPDGTGELVESLQKVYSHLFLIRGNKRGLGDAYIRGMKHAVFQLEADSIMEMDADFSHDPSDIPRFIEASDSYDFIIGSRYIKGGEIPNSWGLFRRLNSRFGNITARFIAGLNPIKDCTAGFRFIKSDIIKKVDFDEMHGKGYCFQINLLHQAKQLGARILEIPVKFTDRTIGKSKLGLKDIVEFFVLVWLIRYQSSKTFVKFAAVGLLGVLVNLGTLTILLKYNVQLYLASLLSIEASIISNFVFNNFWTFRRRAFQKDFFVRLFMFNFVSLISLGVSFTTFVVLTKLFPLMLPQQAQLLGIIPATFINYFLNSNWTFSSKR